MRRSTLRALWILVVVVLTAASAAASRGSIVTWHVRFLFAVTAVVLIASAGYIVIGALAARRRAAIALIAILCVCSAFAASRRTAAGSDELRRAYVAQLLSYQGVPYVFGGETGSGIDCSGLARVSLWQTMLRSGLSHGEPRLIGPGLWRFWWRDLSASDMRVERDGYTRVVGFTKMLAGYDTASLKLGDMAVCETSMHVLIYCGDGKWIEANPKDRRVVINRAPAGSKRPYFRAPMTFVRWKAFD